MTEWQATRGRRKWIVVAVILVMVGFVASAKPLWFRWQVWQVRQAIANRDMRRAIARVEKLQVAVGPRGELSFLLARIQRHREAYGKAREALNRAYELEYPAEELERERLLTLAETGHMALDDPALQKLTANPGGDSREIFEALVKGYYRLYELGPASFVLDNWEETYPEDSQLFLYRGLLQMHKEQWDEAARWFRRAVKLAPDRSELRKNLAKAEQKRYRYRHAIHQYRIALQQREEVETLVGLGTSLKARGGLAKALLFAGRGDDAVPHFKFAASAREELSRVKELRKRVVANPHDVDLRFEIGKSLAKYGNKQDAFKWLSSVLKYDPNHQRTREILATLSEAPRK